MISETKRKPYQKQFCEGRILNGGILVLWKLVAVLDLLTRSILVSLDKFWKGWLTRKTTNVDKPL